ncbi:phage holin [Clostridium sp. C2-6-12]|uniref:phage holin n=1 Tax=Clostridium sp. C2-6-12 TaxID=2698832 RepID=UPI00136A61B1|nr:phage holin [Clostridium sp. C2-6-12]
MNINWKTRFTNKTFLIALSSAVVLLTQQLGLSLFPDNWRDVLNTILTIFILLGVVIDPSTAGISDQKASE